MITTNIRDVRHAALSLPNETATGSADSHINQTRSINDLKVKLGDVCNTYNQFVDPNTQNFSQKLQATVAKLNPRTSEGQRFTVKQQILDLLEKFESIETCSIPRPKPSKHSDFHELKPGEEKSRNHRIASTTVTSAAAKLSNRFGIPEVRGLCTGLLEEKEKTTLTPRTQLTIETAYHPANVYVGNEKLNNLGGALLVKIRKVEEALPYATDNHSLQYLRQKLDVALTPPNRDTGLNLEQQVAWAEHVYTVQGMKERHNHEGVTDQLYEACWENNSAPRNLKDWELLRTSSHEFQNMVSQYSRELQLDTPNVEDLDADPEQKKLLKSIEHELDQAYQLFDNINRTDPISDSYHAGNDNIFNLSKVQDEARETQFGQFKQAIGHMRKATQLYEEIVTMAHFKGSESNPMVVFSDRPQVLNDHVRPVVTVENDNRVRSYVKQRTRTLVESGSSEDEAKATVAAALANCQSAEDVANLVNGH
jgi:hypothetical protein